MYDDDDIGGGVLICVWSLFHVTAVHSPSHQIQQLRLIKSDSEIALLRKSAAISCQGFTQVYSAGEGEGGRESCE